jgi:serine/threonine-protein kinase
LEALTAALADKYLIERELGAGGMAIVYLARDLKHDRNVAVKVFRPELAASIGVDRFLREIQVTAKLQHPHILPLHDSGEAGGQLYYVMPYVEGESLRDLLDREQQLGLQEAVKIAQEAAEALAYAHSYGIVHRDMKPENILLSGGHAIVADFGIARAVSEAGGEKLTQTGMAVGTPAYMSPEQASGDVHVDARTDIYSLGCVLYEMLVGQPPFTGPTPQAVMARHSMDQVPLPHVVRQSIPEDLEAIVLCTLEKAPADRFHTAAELAAALNAVISGEVPRLTNASLARARRTETKRRTVPLGAVVGAVAALAVAFAAWQLWPSASAPAVGGLDPTSIAVLYLEDRSEGGELSYVADGLTEGLIRELSRVQGINVVSRNGSAQFRGSTAAPDSIAGALKVGTLVQGSIEPVGDKLRIMVRLIEGSSGADFDRRSFDVPAGELIAAQDSVSREVSLLLRERLGEEVRMRERRSATQSVDAWALVQRGERMRKDAEELLESGGLDTCLATLGGADSLLALAEVADPSWVEPAVLRSRVAYRRARLEPDFDDRLAAIEQGLQIAEHALEIDPQYPEALEMRGTLRYWYWLQDVTPDPAEAESLLTGAQRDLEAAVDADPGLASAHAWLSYLYYQTESRVAVLLAAQRAYEADAYLDAAPMILARLFFGSYDLEEFTQARRWCDEGQRRFSNEFRFKECQLWVSTFPGVTPDVDRAWQLLDELAALVPEAEREYQRHRGMIIVGAVLARADLPDSARAVLLGARAGADVDPNLELPFIEAHVRTMLGDYDEAVALLQRLFAGYVAESEEDYEWATHWWWRDLQSHPGFRELAGMS